jgi:regulator of cell morphogenesis and NO signaling
MTADATTSDRPADEPTAWETQEPAAIIDFILRRFHEPLRLELPILVRNARQVEAAAAGDPACPTGLADHLDQIRIAVESHLAKEEKILFPLILAGRGSGAFMPIKVMMAEHDDHLANLARTRVLTHGFVLPSGATEAWRELYRELQRIESDLGQHIRLENNVLFTRVMTGDAGGR